MPEKSSNKILVTLVVVSLVGVAITAGAVATEQNAQAESQDTSYLRVVHASPDAPNVDVALENDTVLSDVPFGTVSDYLTVQAGTYNLSITTAGENGTVVYEDTLTINPRSVTTVAAAGEASANGTVAFRPELYNDNAFAPPEDQAALSVIHLSPDAPTVDVTTNDGEVVIAENLSFSDGSDYLNVPEGNYTVEIREATAGNNGTVITTVDLSVEGGNAYTAYAAGYANPTEAPADTPFQILVAQDAMSTVTLPTEMTEENETTTEMEETTESDETETAEGTTTAP